LQTHPPPISTLFPYTTLFRSKAIQNRSRAASRCSCGKRKGKWWWCSAEGQCHEARAQQNQTTGGQCQEAIGYEVMVAHGTPAALDRKSTRLNSSHVSISYAVF